MHEVDLDVKMAGLRIEVFKAIVDTMEIQIPDWVLQRQVERHSDKQVLDYLADYRCSNKLIKRLYRVYKQSWGYLVKQSRMLLKVGKRMS